MSKNLTTMQKMFTKDFEKENSYFVDVVDHVDSNGHKSGVTVISTGKCLSDGVWTLNGNEYKFETFTLPMTDDPVELSKYNLALEDGYYVCTLTGEIMGAYKERVEPKYKEPKMIKPFLSEEHLREWCLEHGLKQTNSLNMNIDGLEEEVKEDTLVKFLFMLREIKYANTAFFGRDELCELLNVSVGNLNKTLNKMVKDGLIKYTSTGLLVKGQVRVTFNPMLVFRGSDVQRARFYEVWNLIPKTTTAEIDHLLPTQETLDAVAAITDEELEEFRKTFEEDDRMYEHFLLNTDETIKSYNIAARDYYGSDCNVKHTILNCTDADFKLFNKGLLPVEELRLK